MRKALTCDKLIGYLNENNKSENKIHGEVLSMRGIPLLDPPDILSTTHHRAFKLVQVNDSPEAGPINLRRLWLKL